MASCLRSTTSNYLQDTQFPPIVFDRLSQGVRRGCPGVRRGWEAGQQN